MFTDAEKAQAEAEEKIAEELRKQELRDVARILELPEGVRLFRRMFVMGKVFSTTYTGNSNTFFQEGERNLALKFFADVCDAAPHKLPLVILAEQKQ